MNRTQAANCINLLIELFPRAELKPAEVSVFLDAFMRFQVQAVMDGLKAHRAVNDGNRPSLAKLCGELGPNAVDRQRRRDATYSEMLRRDLERQRVKNLDTLGDMELFLRVQHRALREWSQPMNEKNEPIGPLALAFCPSREPGIRNLIQTHLSSDSQFANPMTFDLAKEWADVVCGPDVGLFISSMIELRKTDCRMGQPEQSPVEKQEEAAALFGA